MNDHNPAELAPLDITRRQQIHAAAVILERPSLTDSEKGELLATLFAPPRTEGEKDRIRDARGTSAPARFTDAGNPIPNGYTLAAITYRHAVRTWARDQGTTVERCGALAHRLIDEYVAATGRRWDPSAHAAACPGQA